MKRLAVITAVASIGLAGTAVAVSAQTEEATAAVSWAKCTGGDPYLANAECAQIQVPLDYGHPNGKKISVAVSRVKHTDTKHYKGVLIGNPGGPGGSGLYLSGGLASWFTGVGHPEIPAQYDIIGFDPRGVGASVPALTCDPHFSDPVRPDYVPHSAADEAVWLKKSKAYAQACASKFGWLLPHLRTTDAARDIDAIRAALGAEADQLLRLLLRHLPRCDVRHAVPQARPAHGPGRQRRRPGRLVRRAAGAGQGVRAQHQVLLRLDRQVRLGVPPWQVRGGRGEGVLRHARQGAASRPSAAWSARTSSTTRSSTPGTTPAGTSRSPTCSPRT